MNQFLILCALGVSTLTCQAADVAAPAKFERTAIQSSGHVIVVSPEGAYRYGIEHDQRIPTKAIAIGKAARDDYQFFSWQEEEALWLIVQEQLAQAEQAEPKKIKRIRSAFQARIDWPRVVIKDRSTVCVPSLPKSKADDWKDHLLCTAVKEILE